MSTELTTLDSSIVEKVVVGGDLAALSSAERMSYYAAVCESVGLNPLTQPFGYIRLNNRLTLYALKACTDQLRKLHHVSVASIEGKMIGDLYVVTCKVQDKEGRTDVSTGAVAVAGLKGDVLANAIMKTETKAKRRATLSLCGLGILDETETDTIRGAEIIPATASISPPANGTPEKSPEDLDATRERNRQKIRQAPDLETLNKIRDYLAGQNVPEDVAARYELAYQHRLLELTPAKPFSALKDAIHDFEHCQNVAALETIRTKYRQTSWEWTEDELAALETADQAAAERLAPADGNNIPF